MNIKKEDLKHLYIMLAFFLFYVNAHILQKILIIKFDTTNSQVNSILVFYLSINFYIDITEELSKFF